MEYLVKSMLGQWTLVRESLRKSPENTTPPPAPAPASPENRAAARQTNNIHLTKMFGELNEHHKNGDMDAMRKKKGEIKEFALGVPKGDLDIGHLGKLREAYHKQRKQNPLYKPSAANNEQRNKWNASRIDNRDMGEILTHHLGDAKSLKDIYQQHGEAGLETVMRNHGANGTPVREYASFQIKKPGVHEDLADLMNPGKGQFGRRELKRHGVLQKPYFANTKPDPQLQAKVDDTFRDMMDAISEDAPDADQKMQDHEDAVVARSMERFKRHHGFK